jgi:hypothetical protein
MQRGGHGVVFRRIHGDDVIYRPGTVVVQHGGLDRGCAVEYILHPACPDEGIAQTHRQRDPDLGRHPCGHKRYVQRLGTAGNPNALHPGDALVVENSSNERQQYGADLLLTASRRAGNQQQIVMSLHHDLLNQCPPHSWQPYPQTGSYQRRDLFGGQFGMRCRWGCEHLPQCWCGRITARLQRFSVIVRL